MLHDPPVARPRLPFLSRLLRFGGHEIKTCESKDSQRAPPTDRAYALDAISRFILENRLALSAANLRLAHAVFCGESPRLRRQIVAREKLGKAITQEWLDDQVAAEPFSAQPSNLERLAKSLGHSIDRFGETASSTRSAAQDYGRVMAAHVDQLSKASKGSDAFQHVILSSRNMVETSRAFEDRLLRAEAEAESLRHQLAQARHDSLHDALTGLPNRRGFEAIFEGEYREAQASLEMMCVAYCDIDHFKRINDSFGHDTGDNVLRVVGQLLAAMPSDHCHAARHGGEEFVVSFRGLGAEKAREMLDGVRIALGSRRFVHETSGTLIGKVSFSAGLADVFAFSDRHQAMSAADQALYRAKEAGRDRVTIARFD